MRASHTAKTKSAEIMSVAHGPDQHPERERERPCDERPREAPGKPIVSLVIVHVEARILSSASP